MRILWQLSCAVALGIASTIGAAAAELDVMPAPYAGFRTPPPRAFNWTSCYLGGHFGWGLADNDLTGTFLAPLPTGATVATSVNVASTVPINLGGNGFLLGGQVGCNLQFASSWVIGFEADASWANIQASNRQTFAGTFTDASGLFPTTTRSDGTLTSKTDFVATATARLGYAIGWMGQGLLYGKGGAAWITNRYDFTGQVTSNVCTVIQFPPPQCLVSFTQVDVFRWTARKTLVGWTIGAGVEWVMWGNWTIKGEYDFLDFGNQTIALNDQVFGPVNVTVRHRINEFKVGFNYRFGPSVLDRAPW
jgi:opacity protein-like surface antigen